MSTNQPFSRIDLQQLKAKTDVDGDQLDSDNDSYDSY
jgi:hypothetical protein